MSYAQKVIEQVKQRDPGQPEFHQAVTEVLESLEPALARYPKYEQNKILDLHILRSLTVVLPDLARPF